MGRPRKEIDWKQFDKLCEILCTQEEIAAWFGVSVDTIERACEREYGLSFAEYYKTASAPGKISLRRKQWQAASKGSNVMLIWLGKQWLGQKDTPEDVEDQGKTLNALVSAMVNAANAANVQPETGEDAT